MSELFMSARESSDEWPDSVDTSEAAVVIVVPRAFFLEPRDGQPIQGRGMCLMSQVPPEVMSSLLRVIADGFDAAAPYTRPEAGSQN